MRGDLVSRPVDEVLGEAEKLVEGRRAELLVISQDTSAYGVDLKYADRRPGAAASARAHGRPVPADSASSAPGCACTTSIRIRTSTR